MIIRLLSHSFFILTFITYSAIFGYFGDLQYLEIPNFPNIRTLSLAFGKGIANLRKTKSYLRLIIGLSSGKALDKWCMSKRPLAVSAVLAVLQILENRNNRNNCTLAFGSRCFRLKARIPLSLRSKLFSCEHRPTQWPMPETKPPPDLPLKGEEKEHPDDFLFYNQFALELGEEADIQIAILVHIRRQSVHIQYPIALRRYRHVRVHVSIVRC